MLNSLRYYRDVIRPMLILKYNYCKVQAVPKLEKAEITIFLSNLSGEDDWRGGLAVKFLTVLTGQKCHVKRFGWSSDSGRERRFVFSCGVTLRKKNLYQFLEYFTVVVLPLYYRRYGYAEFSGCGGVYSLYVKDLGLFYRQNEDVIGFDGGVQISLVSNTVTKEECLSLVGAFGFPVENKNK